MNAETGADWRDEIFEVLQTHDIKQVYHVPDAGHSRLIEQCQRSNSIRTVPLTTEEEGIALAAGAWLGGQRSALLMQSSGVGNTINMMGLTKTLRFPFLTLITMPRPCRSKSRAPNSSSRRRIWRLSAGCAMRSLSAALLRLPSSATWTSVRSWPKSMRPHRR